MSTPLLRLGSAWYPEHWDDAVLAEDLRLMQELGFDTVRVGDFAWSRLEPEDGRFDTEWLGRAMDCAHQHGIGVILCTPTAGPPAWLMHAHPEIGWVERTGYRHGIGGRQSADYCHPLFQHYSRRITETMARDLGRHPALIAWQTDNEFGGHQKVSLSAAALAGWHRWLERRYGTIGRLNADWGTHIWSNHYHAFDEVPGPHPLPTYCHHFSLHAEYRRYMLDAVLEFQRQQVAIIRAHSAAPITHNSEDSVDEWDLTRDLDLAAHDCYTSMMPVESVVYRMDCFRALKPGRRFWVMETGPDGELADGPFPAGWLANVTTLSYASGAEGVSFWPWRSNRSGAESANHDGLLHPCGVRTSAWEPAVRASAVRRRLAGILCDFSPAPARIAFVRSERNGHANYIERIAGLEPNFDYRGRVESHHRELLAIGAWRDVIYDQAEVAGYGVVISPYLPYTTPEFLARMRKHLAAGGVWVVGPYSGYLTGCNTSPMNGLLGDLGAMLGLDVRAWTTAKQQAIALPDGTTTQAQMRAHAFAPAAGDEVLGTYAGDRIGGLAWGLRRRVGGGTVYVLGSEIAADARRQLYRGILEREGVPLHPLPSQVLRFPQVDGQGRCAWVLVNAGRQPCRVPLPATGRDLLSDTVVSGELPMAANGNAVVLFDRPVAG